MARHDVEAGRVLEQLLQLVEVELQVGVAEEHQLAARVAQAGAQRSAIAPVALVSDRSDPPIARAERVDQLAASVARAVVDENDLELGCQARRDRHRGVDQQPQVLDLVEDREHERQGGSHSCGGRLRVFHSRYPRARRRSATMASSSAL